ncbi:hypothetical protein BSL78_12062 [Apostichopus japonicus]|uniref:Uncharacterized protein n=1 Tax=Stichopus japonicus TaxID=307972 RepID=A0A2G8KST4_STIJA|nr:hypothetical protein BSL78_12062 [Apostichopus japonicus]
MKKIKSIQNQLDKQNEKLKVKPVDLLYRKIPNDGTFCSITVGILLGSVNLRSNQIIHTFNERKTSGGVLLICVDPKDSSKEYWRHLEKIDNHDDPVVMSNLAMYYDSGHHPLFAVGNTVFIVHPHRNDSLYDSVKSVSSMVIDEVPEGSWITSITAHRPNKNPNNEFIIFTSCDHSIREYNVSGYVLRVIYTRDFVRSNVYPELLTVIIYLLSLVEVLIRQLIDSDDTVKQCVTLRLPSTMSGMLPINIIWTCSRWLVLYISKGVEKEWKVVDYGKTGEFVKVCVEGTSSNEMDVPFVSLDVEHWTCYFANTNVRTFQY